MNTLPLLSFILSIVSIIVTCTGLYLTNSRFNRTMLDNLDSKSGWRKTLYELAGESILLRLKCSTTKSFFKVQREKL